MLKAYLKTARPLVAVVVVGALVFTPMLTSAVGEVGLPAGGYTENFDTLANTGTSSTLPAGWALLETGNNFNTTYSAGDGSSNAGETYSFGTVGSPDRAFGTLRSNNLASTIGVGFTNNTGITAQQATVMYACEQWRLGTTGAADRLDFQYSTNATSISTGTWIDVNLLDCISPNTMGSVGSRDGNLPINRAMRTNTFSLGTPVAPGATLWLRWLDFSASGLDDGLGVDDFSIQLLTPTGDAPEDLAAYRVLLPFVRR